MPPLNNPDRPQDRGKIGLPSVDGGQNRIAPNALKGGKGSKDDAKYVALGSKPSDDKKLLNRARNVTEAV